MLDNFISYTDGVLSIDLKYPVRKLKTMDAKTLVKASAVNVLTTTVVLGKNVYDIADSRYHVTERVSQLDEQYKVSDTLKQRSAQIEESYQVTSVAKDTLDKLCGLPKVGKVVTLAKDSVVDVTEETCTRLAQRGINLPLSPSAATDDDSDEVASNDEDADDDQAEPAESPIAAHQAALNNNLNTKPSGRKARRNRRRHGR